jgi:hypothetical protein
MLALPHLRKVPMLLLVLSLSLCTRAQDTTTLLRPAFTLKMAVDKDHYYEANIKSAPYMLPDTSVQIYPGETIYLEVTQENGVIKKMTAVSVIKDSAVTLTIHFYQETEGKSHSMMMLNVKNPFPYQLIYKARMYILTQKRWVSTDVYPVESGLSSYETWPDLLTSIALNGWTLKHE